MKKKLNGLGMVLSKRSIAPLIVFAFAQTACDEDPDAWADIVVDGGLDGSVTVGSDASTGETSTGSTLDTAGLTVSVDTTEDEVTLDASIDDTTGESDVDASVTSAPTGPVVTSEDTSAETSEPVSAGTTAVTSETSAPPTSANPTSETPTSDTSTSETPTSETPTTGPASETSAPTGGETSTAEASSSETTSDSSDAGAPALLVCGDVINEAEAISLEAALANYPGETADAGGGDGGVVFADCYPPCIAALTYACPAGAMNECTTEYEGYDTIACWGSGVSQVLTYTYDYEAYVLHVTQSVYNGAAPCITGTRSADYESGISTYAWYDGTGALVATGTGEGEQVDVTCVGDAQVYPVDRSQPQCAGFSEAVYEQLDCGIYNY